MVVMIDSLGKGCLLALFVFALRGHGKDARGLRGRCMSVRLKVISCRRFPVFSLYVKGANFAASASPDMRANLDRTRESMVGWRLLYVRRAPCIDHVHACAFCFFVLQFLARDSETSINFLVLG